MCQNLLPEILIEFSEPIRTGYKYLRREYDADIYDPQQGTTESHTNIIDGFSTERRYGATGAALYDPQRDPHNPDNEHEVKKLEVPARVFIYNCGWWEHDLRGGFASNDPRNKRTQSAQKAASNNSFSYQRASTLPQLSDTERVFGKFLKDIDLNTCVLEFEFADRQTMMLNTLGSTDTLRFDIEKHLRVVKNPNGFSNTLSVSLPHELQPVTQYRVVITPAVVADLA